MCPSNTKVQIRSVGVPRCSWFRVVGQHGRAAALTDRVLHCRHATDVIAKHPSIPLSGVVGRYGRAIVSRDSVLSSPVATAVTANYPPCPLPGVVGQFRRVDCAIRATKVTGMCRQSITRIPQTSQCRGLSDAAGALSCRKIRLCVVPPNGSHRKARIPPIVGTCRTPRRDMISGSFRICRVRRDRLSFYFSPLPGQV
jgi:hypothetical protein